LREAVETTPLLFEVLPPAFSMDEAAGLASAVLNVEIHGETLRKRLEDEEGIAKRRERAGAYSLVPAALEKRRQKARLFSPRFSLLAQESGQGRTNALERQGVREDRPADGPRQSVGQPFLDCPLDEGPAWDIPTSRGAA